MNENTRQLTFSRILVAGVVIILILGGLLLVFNSIRQAVTADQAEPEEVNALAASQSECVTCHRKETPGIVQQYGYLAPWLPLKLPVGTATRWPRITPGRWSTREPTCWSRLLRRCAKPATSSRSPNLTRAARASGLRRGRRNRGALRSAAGSVSIHPRRRLPAR